VIISWPDKSLEKDVLDRLSNCSYESYVAIMAALMKHLVESYLNVLPGGAKSLADRVLALLSNNPDAAVCEEVVRLSEDIHEYVDSPRARELSPLGMENLLRACDCLLCEIAGNAGAVLSK
jgi:hypothetical protein